MPHRKRNDHKKKGKHTAGTLNRSDENFLLKGRIWIDGPEGTFIGYGRVVLLERIKKFGSITKAARSMNMSYRHAWELVDSMNRQAPEPFIVTAAGGKGGGGTLVTAHGERAIKVFWNAFASLQDFLQNESKHLTFSKEE